LDIVAEFRYLAKVLGLLGIHPTISRSMDYSFNHPVTDESQPCHYIILHSFPAPDLEARWREYLKKLDYPSHYDTPEFFLEPYWEGQHPFAILAFDRGAIIGVLTGLHDQRVLCGDSSRPQISLDKANTVIADRILAEGLLAEAGNTNLITMFTWESTPLPSFEKRGFQARELQGDVVLDLSAGTQTLFNEFPKNRRRDIRTAIRPGIEVSEETTEDDLTAYWEVYSAWRRTKRKKIHHNRSFASLKKVHDMQGNHRRFLARYQGKVIAAAGIRFCPGGLVEFANNCSLDEYLKLLPNDLLVWRTIEWACEHGFKRYSLGAAHPFLRKWGGELVSIYRYRIDRSFLHRYDLKDDIATIVRTVPLLKFAKKVLRKIA